MTPEKDIPWVTVVVTCYNHAEYVEAALESVMAQTYPRVELIIIDNASTDGSARVIDAWVKANAKPEVRYLPQSENLGLCRAFNLGWEQGRGAFCIDLASDDYLLPERVAVGVKEFADAGEDYGVHFCDCQDISPLGQPLENFYWANVLPQDEVFADVLRSYCIPIPSLMFRRTMLEALGGYDEQLHYEDFDIMVRAARTWKFRGHPDVLVYKRELPHAKNYDRFSAESPHLETTAQVCEWAYEHCQAEEEFAALRQRVDYEFRESLRVGHHAASTRFLALSQRLSPRTWKTGLLERWARLSLPKTSLSPPFG